ncbi:unnamed protein product [Hyaloperonospora brassicae]|uniref:Protein kinase domain-containing protein n=1 Tax=Hyaloperonospora brassicae TaxID=162125 RepID=A0AAV0V0H3_HYABA|nr:unnamed protein product [Hyaloperonospora brassicae]
MATDLYITLTPTASCSSSWGTCPASDLLARKWAAAVKRRAQLETTAKHEADHEAECNVSRTETDHSSETGNGGSLRTEEDDVSTRADSDVGIEDEREVGQAEDEEDDDVDDAEGKSDVIPTYVCALHDPKPVLVAEQIPCHRVDIRPCQAGNGLDNRSGNNVFQYEIALGRTHQTFVCSPSKTLKIFRKLSRDKACADQLQFVETNCLKGGILGLLKRMCTSPVKMSTEVRDVLDAISDMDTLLMNSTYQDLVGATKGSMLSRELEKLLESHDETLVSGTPCMCNAYYASVKRYGDFFHQQAQTAKQIRHSTVASETLMRSRSVLSYYSDTIYILDKRMFRPMHGLKQCIVYGFGRRKLFEIVRTSRKQWSLRHMDYGEIFTLSLTKYAGDVHHMVAIKRMVPDVQHGGLRQENVCFVKKSKRQGYRCLLMSEVISQGKVTTSISIQQPKSPQGDPNFHYMTMSEVSGRAPASVCSSTLSVPCERYKYLQRLNVSGGSDVVLYMAIAVSYDILVGALSYWLERKY